MRINLTKTMYEQATHGICPFCQTESLEENADETQINQGYSDYCYSCNAQVKIKKTYAKQPTEGHFQL